MPIAEFPDLIKTAPMAQCHLIRSSSFWQSPAVGGFAGAIAALAMSALSAFAMRRYGQEMNWAGILAGGVAGGLVGHFVLRLVLSLLKRPGSNRSSMDRFAWLLIWGLIASLVLGALGMMVVVHQSPIRPEDGVRVLGARVFVMVGWLVGILASSLPLAIVELQSEDASNSA